MAACRLHLLVAAAAHGVCGVLVALQLVLWLLHPVVAATPSKSTCPNSSLPACSLSCIHPLLPGSPYHLLHLPAAASLLPHFPPCARALPRPRTLPCSHMCLVRVQMVWGVLVAVKNGLLATGRFMWTFPARVQRWRATTPEEWARWRRDLWRTTKQEAHHYWVRQKGGCLPRPCARVLMHAHLHMHAWVHVHICAHTHA